MVNKINTNSNRAILWVEDESIALQKIKGEAVISRMLKALQIPEIERIALIVSMRQKEKLKDVVFSNAIDWLIVESVSDFGETILQSEDWFKGFEGNVLLAPANLPFIDSQTLHTLIQCQNQQNSVGCLPLVRTKPIGQNLQVVMNNEGKVIRVTDSNIEINASAFTGFPWCFEWDCLQRVLYQVGTDRDTYPLPAIVEKATDNGFEIAAQYLADAIPLSALTRETEKEIIKISQSAF